MLGGNISESNRTSAAWEWTLMGPRYRSRWGENRGGRTWKLSLYWQKLNLDVDHEGQNSSSPAFKPPPDGRDSSLKDDARWVRSLRFATPPPLGPCPQPEAVHTASRERLKDALHAVVFSPARCQGYPTAKKVHFCQKRCCPPPCILARVHQLS